MTLPPQYIVNRRTALLGITAATAFMHSTSMHRCGSRTAFAIEPFERPAKTILRPSLAAYSFRDLLTGKLEPKMDLFGFVDWCHAQGLAGVELTSYYFPDNTDEAYLLELKRHCHLRGVSISGGAIRNNFCASDDEVVRRDLEHTKKWIDHYALLGAPVIRIFAGDQPSEWDKERTISRCARATNAACEYAASKGVMLGLENHGGITAYAEDLLAIIKRVDSPALGINFDSGNFRSTADPYAELEMIAPYAINAQVKIDVKPNGKSQEADFGRIIQILRNARYSGWVALEYEGDNPPLEDVPLWLDKLHAAIDA